LYLNNTVKVATEQAYEAAGVEVINIDGFESNPKRQKKTANNELLKCINYLNSALPTLLTDDKLKANVAALTSAQALINALHNATAKLDLTYDKDKKAYTDPKAMHKFIAECELAISTAKSAKLEEFYGWKEFFAQAASLFVAIILVVPAATAVWKNDSRYAFSLFATPKMRIVDHINKEFDKALNDCPNVETAPIGSADL
jgi:hypothetical protein